MSREQLAALAAACRRLGLWFISDEIYHGLTYERPAETALAIDDDAVVINSFSKYYCMTGWRMTGPTARTRPARAHTHQRPCARGCPGSPPRVRWSCPWVSPS
jgi:aspartate/methionine/tyrosine aminotransferase